MKYRKKPVVIEALQFETNNETGDVNMNKIVSWINQGKSPGERHAWHNGTNIFIETLEGTMRSEVGDFVIRGVEGEFYSCKKDIFYKTYELVQPERTDAYAAHSAESCDDPTCSHF